MDLRWNDLNPIGRTIIVLVAALTTALAAAAFATSYGALYNWIGEQHLYSDRLNRIWPSLLDAAFIVAELAAILGGMLRGGRGWPFLTMLLTGALTVWFNIQHAGADPGRRLAASLPPILMMLAFQVDLSITKWVMKALGKPLDGGDVAAPQAPAGPTYQLAPQHYYPPQAVSAPSFHENGQNGQGRPSKRKMVESYLAGLGPEALKALTARQVAKDLTERGYPVTERTVIPVLRKSRQTS